MQLDNSVKYQRIGSKFLEGIIGLTILMSLYLIFQYIAKGDFEIKHTIVSFGGIMLLFLIIAIINETIDYNQKYYEYLSNKNYLKVKQSEDIEISIEDNEKLLDNIERQILGRKNNWLLSNKNEDTIEFQTKIKSIMNYLIEDRIVIKIETSDKLRIESAPMNKFVFLDSSRNLGNILFVRNEIKKAAVNIGYDDKPR